MGFLDNSGDIILDAVFTDAGRRRLAKGDGSYKIAKFALGDDEIDYSNYNPNHPSGSSFYDLEVLQTPVLEAFTNNTSFLKSKLVTITRSDLLYLPVVKVNENPQANKRVPSGFGQNAFIITVDSDTEDTSNSIITAGETGVIYGSGENSPNTTIRLDQGLDTTEISPARGLSPELVENSYIIQIDHRFGQIVASNDVGQLAPLSFIDDDEIASYQVSTANTDFVSVNNSTSVIGQGDATNETIAGPRGTTLRFSVRASDELNGSTYLFTTLGSESTKNGQNIYFIDTYIRVTGGTTGYRVDVPVRFLKRR